MRTIQIAPTAAGDVTEETLKLGPSRLLTFLQGVADPAIRAQFAPIGWSDERLEEAWSLLTELKAISQMPTKRAVDPVAEAIGACEAWQATGLIRARAMLQLSFPEQARFMFHDFVTGKGTAAVLNVATFLQRRHMLETGADRKASRKADHEALALMEETGVTKKVLDQLHGFVETVQTVATQPQPVFDTDAKRIEVLRKIHAWVTAWSEMARTVITRRDQMIRLGLAKRRPRKAKDAGATPVVPPVASPATPAPPAVTPTPPAAGPSHAGDEATPESHAA